MAESHGYRRTGVNPTSFCLALFKNLKKKKREAVKRDYKIVKVINTLLPIKLIALQSMIGY